MRDHEVPAGRGRTPEQVERRHAGGRDALDLGFRRAGLERVDRLGAPRDAQARELLLDPADDVLRRHKGFQYGSGIA